MSACAASHILQKVDSINWCLWTYDRWEWELHALQQFALQLVSKDGNERERGCFAKTIYKHNKVSIFVNLWVSKGAIETQLQCFDRFSRRPCTKFSTTAIKCVVHDNTGCFAAMTSISLVDPSVNHGLGREANTSRLESIILNLYVCSYLNGVIQDRSLYVANLERR